MPTRFSAQFLYRTVVDNKKRMKIMSEINNYVHTVQYYECDPMGVLHHSNYVRIMEESRVEWMDQMGFGYERMEAEGVVSPVTAVSLEYKRMAKFRDKIRVVIRVEELGTVRLRIRYQMFVDDALCLTATSTHCFIENGRPIALERRFPEFFAALKSQMQD